MSGLYCLLSQGIKNTKEWSVDRASFISVDGFNVKQFFFSFSHVFFLKVILF